MGIDEGPFQNVTSLFGENAVATITGTVITSLLEGAVVAGGKTIIVTLEGAEWVSAGTEFDDARQAIINGLDSEQSETLGWNNEVRDNLAVGTIARTSNTVCTITLSTQADYLITSDETITVTVPASAINSSNPLTADPQITVTDTGDFIHAYRLTISPSWVMILIPQDPVGSDNYQTTAEVDAMPKLGYYVSDSGGYYNNSGGETWPKSCNATYYNTYTSATRDPPCGFVGSDPQYGERTQIRYSHPTNSGRTQINRNTNVQPYINWWIGQGFVDGDTVWYFE